ncbi:hypothetical protein [Streptomyces ureilyticus]|uniref:Uncharacterized protein n=1 Tax=Streptomyces ureilyticus TaxID=1775131 RepID=A0ABX0DKY7_9ACTN|nr:hypothetical protein [Streptomyces ureilyticus]NGO42537.1 hypothetical protein [Streptomyces ureilyticus]
MLDSREEYHGGAARRGRDKAEAFREKTLRDINGRVHQPSAAVGGTHRAACGNVLARVEDWRVLEIAR